MDKTNQELSEGFELIQDITAELDRLKESSPKKEIQAARQRALEGYQKVSQILLTQDRPWLSARVDLMRISLLCEMADGKKAQARIDDALTALDLAMEVLENRSEERL